MQFKEFCIKINARSANKHCPPVPLEGLDIYYFFFQVLDQLFVAHANSEALKAAEMGDYNRKCLFPKASHDKEMEDGTEQTRAKYLRQQLMLQEAAVQHNANAGSN